MAGKPIPLEKRFWRNVAKGSPDSCWPWQGFRNAKGYGKVSITHGRAYKSAHRIAWTLAYGDPGGLWVLHHCDNPPCCNPRHLFLGTNADNVADMIAKGRKRVATGSRVKGSKLTPDKVRMILTEVGSSRAIGAKYGVSKTAITKIRSRQSWRELRIEGE